MYYKKFSFDNALDDVVKYGWIMKSHEAAQSDVDLLIPDGYPEIIFVLHGAYHKRGVLTDGETTITSSCVIGIQSQSIFASRTDNCHLIGLKLYPWAAYRIFGNKLKLTANKNVYFEGFGFQWLSELQDQLHLVTKESSIIECLSHALSHQIRQKSDDTSWQTAAAYVQTILDTDGQISVQELSQKHCLSVRHLERKFKAYYGISPKKFANIIRFKKLYKSSVLQKKLPDNFLEYGYYDQMHFIKDFYKQLRTTPSKAKEKAFQRQHDIAKMTS